MEGEKVVLGKDLWRYQWPVPTLAFVAVCGVKTFLGKGKKGGGFEMRFLFSTATTDGSTLRALVNRILRNVFWHNKKSSFAGFLAIPVFWKTCLLSLSLESDFASLEKILGHSHFWAKGRKFLAKDLIPLNTCVSFGNWISQRSFNSFNKALKELRESWRLFYFYDTIAEQVKDRFNGRLEYHNRTTKILDKARIL